MTCHTIGVIFFINNFDEINYKSYFLIKFIMFVAVFIFLYCCAGWRYTVAFSKVLTMYQIYHN
jgi:spore coat protein U-like protein